MVVGAGGREGAVSLCAVFDTHDTLSLSPLSCLVPGPRRELRGQLVSGNFQSCLHLVITPVPGQRATTRVRAMDRQPPRASLSLSLTHSLSHKHKN